MANEFDTLQTSPILTLEPFAEEPKAPVVVEEKEVVPEVVLTEEEQRMVDSFAKQIDLTNSAVILQYGAGTQKKMGTIFSKFFWGCGPF